MYDMYPANWPAIDARERKAAATSPYRPATASDEARAVQEAMNRRDNGGEPKK